MGTSIDPLYSSQPDHAELAAKVVSIFSISSLSLLFGIKTFNVHFKYLTYSRWLVICLYLLSWSFTTASMLLVTTNNNNYASCFLSIMVCDIFYFSTKIVIYTWLIEKIYVVSSIRQTRWKSNTYRFHLCLLLPYIAIFVLMMIFHVAEIDESGICIIGLQSIASLPLLIYDFLINFYMALFFIRPLIKLGKNTKSTNWRTSRLNEVALRTLIASIVCLLASFANIFSLFMFQGRERGLICLTCCTVDVTINVITVHWVTSQAPGKRRKEIGVDYNTHHYPRDSSPDNSDYHQKQDPEFLCKNDIDMEIMVTQQQANAYNYTKNDFQIDHLRIVSPYSSSKVNKDDQASLSESNSCNFSIHESQISRKSLTTQ
ncbi:uncharacterized protein BX663DRAFT_481151 [Cokeromyces recurvatus]|uniref:uncharacterized protein n=1 Tax=Cokeromyces recurvatus TaxID=90255 RepID=UPI0022211B75|nr:uncharacterized protein BX663DRAFT_481151 [Cokeromyces recurvatus]KAI7897833.1 hypothetical protein BX663DRAFT_481151 [Cokeromyces recurvatus]